MKVINFQNIDEILLNKEIKSLFPELQHLFDQFILTEKFPILNNLKQRTKLDFLNKVDENILENYFQESIKIERIDYNIVKNLKYNLETTGFFVENFENFTITRTDQDFLISFWR